MEGERWNVCGVAMCVVGGQACAPERPRAEGAPVAARALFFSSSLRENSFTSSFRFPSKTLLFPPTNTHPPKMLRLAAVCALLAFAAAQVSWCAGLADTTTWQRVASCSPCATETFCPAFSWRPPALPPPISPPTHRACSCTSAGPGVRGARGRAARKRGRLPRSRARARVQKSMPGGASPPPPTFRHQLKSDTIRTPNLYPAPCPPRPRPRRRPRPRPMP